VLYIRHNGARLGLGASATSLGARTVARPAGDLAVNGAEESVARGNDLVGTTRNTAVDSGVDDGADLIFGTNATSLGAASELRPTRILAIDRASKSVAWKRVRQGRADNTSVSYVGNNRASLGLRTRSTTRLGAGRVT
jgi:hypothetical protein